MPHQLRGQGPARLTRELNQANLAPGVVVTDVPTPLQAAVREVQEEILVTPLEIEERGTLSFQFVDGYTLHANAVADTGLVRSSTVDRDHQRAGFGADGVGGEALVGRREVAERGQQHIGMTGRIRVLQNVGDDDEGTGPAGEDLQAVEVGKSAVEKTEVPLLRLQHREPLRDPSWHPVARCAQGERVRKLVPCGRAEVERARFTSAGRIHREHGAERHAQRAQPGREPAAGRCGR